ncbi:hypothetical protein BD410DRAFT_893577 [Rickenella mellea]|uniref:WW domain-containing protein n=1 Tax=Rickenella mellea TaxID=50990 RepID=A0A4Y7QMK1_9AGAM|nr:hypothetical protein BD410DRAFT_893577 [Rickenella mellea]
MDNDNRPLPYGWVKQFDSNYNRPFYVDTKATPPRSIWVHPYEDEQYLRDHPEVREKIGRPSSAEGYRPPPGPPTPQRPASYNGDADKGKPGSSTGKLQKDKRGFFGKLKDKAVGTKEEREAARLAEQRMMEERRRRMQEAAAQGRFPQGPGYPQQAGFSQGGFHQGYPQPGYYPQQYGAPAFAPPQRRAGFGGGGFGVPLLGGLAGGLLLGEAFDGFGGDGGDGGGFGGDGGDFGGGDFGGGGDF